MSETALLVAIREALSREPGVLLWRNNSGRLQDAGGRWVQYGLGVGGADLVGLVGCLYSTDVEDPGPHADWCPWSFDGDAPSAATIARFFALEVKTAAGKMRKEQECWARAVRGVGGFCATVRSVEDAVAALGRCREGATK